MQDLEMLLVDNIECCMNFVGIFICEIIASNIDTRPEILRVRVAGR